MNSPFGLGEKYARDRGYRLVRLMDSAVFGVSFVTRNFIFSKIGVVVLLGLYLVIQVTITQPQYLVFGKWPWIGPWLVTQSTSLPWLRGLVDTATSIVMGAILLIPNMFEAFRDRSSENRYAEHVKTTSMPKVEHFLREMVKELRKKRLGAGCTGNIRANVALVKRQVLHRYLEHIASSKSRQHDDREICFKLDEGLPGYAYARPGTIHVKTYINAAPLLRQVNRERVNPSNKVIAARAIAFDPRTGRPPWSNKVVGVLIVTSDDEADLTRFQGEAFGDIIGTSVASIFPLLRELREAHDGY